MRFPFLQFVRVLLGSVLVPALAVAASESSAPVPGALAREQFPWAFARVPMAGVPRSIAIPLATNLHVAYDASLLRLHTAWSGGALTLSGHPFGRASGPALCSFNGTTLWSTPPVCPWQAMTNLAGAAASAPSVFRGLSTKGGGVTLLYDIADGAGGRVRIHETPRGQTVGGAHAIIRRYEITATPHALRLLAHAETGTNVAVASNRLAFVVQRAGDALLVAARGAAGGLHSESSHGVTELWLDIPPHPEAVAVEVASLVCPSEAEARKHAHGLAAAVVAPPRLDFPARRAPESGAAPAPEFHTAASVASAGGDDFFRRETIPVPRELDLLVGGLDWLTNGQLALAAWPGEIYLVEGLAGAATNLLWRRFASGLHEPLGLKIVQGEMLVAQKCELTRLRDTDGNGAADLHETVNAQWGFEGDAHSFAYGPALDAQGNFYVTLDGNTQDWKPRWEVPFRGWAVKISPDGGRLEGVASGLRSPNGCFAFGPDADIFCTDNEGYWIGACKLNHCRPGKFFGYPSSTPRPRERLLKPEGFDPPAVWFPRSLATSASGGVAIPATNFGPFAGQLLVGDFGTASLLRVALERVNGEWQGAVWPFARGFLSGVNRLAFGPDGRLYVGGLKRTWSSSGPQEFALERLTFTGAMPFAVREVHARPDGFVLSFTQPVAPASLGAADQWKVTQFGYQFHSAYGSPEIDHEGKPHRATPISVTGVNLSADGLQATLALAGWKPGYVTTVRCASARNAQGAALGQDTFYYTLNQIPK